MKVETKIKMCQSLQIDDIISKLKTEELILGLLKADQKRNAWIMLKEMTQSKQVATSHSPLTSRALKQHRSEQQASRVDQ